MRVVETKCHWYLEFEANHALWMSKWHPQFLPWRKLEHNLPFWRIPPKMKPIQLGNLLGRPGVWNIKKKQIHLTGIINPYFNPNSPRYVIENVEFAVAHLTEEASLALHRPSLSIMHPTNRSHSIHSRKVLWWAVGGSEEKGVGEAGLSPVL